MFPHGLLFYIRQHVAGLVLTTELLSSCAGLSRRVRTKCRRARPGAACRGPGELAQASLRAVRLGRRGSVTCGRGDTELRASGILLEGIARAQTCLHPCLDCVRAGRGAGRAGRQSAPPRGAAGGGDGRGVVAQPAGLLQAHHGPAARLPSRRRRGGGGVGR